MGKVKSFFVGLVASTLALVGALVPLSHVSAAGSYAWTTANGLSSATCIRLASSYTGQYMACANLGGAIYTSADYGQNWTEQPGSGSRNWSGISMSGDGKYLVATDTSDTFTLSSDYGVTWTDHTTASGDAWSNVAMSGTGKYITLINTGNNGASTSSDYGVTWVAASTGTASSPLSVAVSQTGQYQGIGYNSDFIYTSSDYGVTWTARASVGNATWTGISISEDGQKFAASGVNGSTGIVYRSTDSGVTWSDISPANARDFHSVVISNDGQTIVVTQYYFDFSTFSTAGNVYETYDGGQTWTTDPNLPADTGWSSINGSGDRSRLAVRNMSNNNVYVGTNPALYVAPVTTPPTTNPPTTQAANSTVPGAPNTGVQIDRQVGIDRNIALIIAGISASILVIVMVRNFSKKRHAQS